MNKTRSIMNVSIAMNCINVAGNAIGIFVLHAGVAGVAVPSLISRTFAAVVMLTLAFRQDQTLYLRFRQVFAWDGKMVKRILNIALPSSVENGLFQLSKVALSSIVALFGTVEIAANGVANSLDSMGCIVGQGMNLAMITVIGQCVGAGDLAQVRYYTKKLLLITYAATAVINSLILLFLHPILALYGLGEEATGLAYILVMIHDGMAMLLWPASFVLPNMLRACNDVKYTMVTAIFSMVAFRIGLSLMFGVHMGMGAIGVWTAMVVDWIFRVCCFVGRYFRGTWRRHCNL